VWFEGGMVDSPDMRESCGGDRDEVLLCDPIFPVLHKHVQCALVVLHLAEREFVNDRVIVRINENARRYPRLAWAHSGERLVKERLSAEYALPREQTTLRWQQKSDRCLPSACAQL
jgi:hypothetical protein